VQNAQTQAITLYRLVRTRPIFAAVLAMLSAGVVYVNALDNPFVYDDQRLILENPTIETPSRWRELLRQDATRPLVNISFAIDRAVFGPSPFGFHLTSIVLHMVNVGLLFALVWLVLADRARRSAPDARAPSPAIAAVAAAMLFAVHPMMTQAVGYISGRAEVMCATFLLLALLAVRAWFRTRYAHWLLAALLLWMAGVLSKENAVMLPAALLGFDWIVDRADRRATTFRLVWLHVPMLAIGAFAVLVRLLVFAVIEHPDAFAPNAAYVFLQFVVLQKYVALLIAPGGQSVFQHVVPVTGLFDPRLLAGFAVVAGLAWLAWRMRRREPLVTFGLLWFVLMLVPSMALVVLDRGEPMAEHRVYTAAAGFFLAAGVGAGWLATRLSRARQATRVTVAVAAVVFVLTLGAQTVLRGAVWDDPVALWTEAVGGAPDHWLPNLALGEALQQAGRCNEAIGRFMLALADQPGELAIYAKLGVCLLDVRSYDEARAAFEELRRRHPGSNEASNGLGAVALLAGQRDEARRYYRETLGRDPWNVAAHRGMAAVEEPTNPAAALGHCEAIAHVAPGTPGNDDCISRNRARVTGGGGR
jgi:tetratricopeptide (TPR) repeat protein